MSVIDWLLEGDPAIRWQVMRDLLDADPDRVAAERSRVAREGWGARLLALQQPYVGLTARAESFGGLWVTEGGVYPRLTILTGIPGDLDHDGDVDLSDLAALLGNYGMTSGASYDEGDLDHDGDVDLSDLAELLSHYGYA